MIGGGDHVTLGCCWEEYTRHTRSGYGDGIPRVPELNKFHNNLLLYDLM